MQKNVAVFGKGLLAEMVCEQLAELCEVLRQNDWIDGVPEAVQLAVVVHDDWEASVNCVAEAEPHLSGIPWLRGFIASHEGIVGPLVRPGNPGCFECADNRRFTADYTSGDILQAAAPSLSALRQIACLLVEETLRVLRGDMARTEEHIFIVQLRTLNTSLHYVLPDPSCSVCGRMEDDSSTAARIVLKPNPKIVSDSYRITPLSELKEDLIRDYFDRRTGLFNDKMHDLVSPFAGVAMNLPSFMAKDEITAGRSHSYAESDLTAILEGLERRCGQFPRGKRTVINDSFSNVASHALDPTRAGLYSEEQYALPDFPFEPFDSDQPIDWVWGYSLMQESPILVPEILAYYSSSYGGGFILEGSNGCALGGSLEEAIMYGMLEVIERDSFLMTWYAKLPAPRLDPSSAEDLELKLMIERLKVVAGCEVDLFNTTTENGIPSIWAMAKSGTPGNMNIICAAGAHLDPVRAAKSAIHEIAGLLFMLQEKFEEGRKNFEQMLHDPYLVQSMEDHVMLYGLPEAEERLHFLSDPSRPWRTFGEEFKQRVCHDDLTDDLKHLIRTFDRLNMEVIVVNQSTEETLRNGLHCVKVLIPGMLPMTFGHHLTRLTGLERVLRVPHQLGFTEEPLTVEQLNPHPHPFV